MASLNITVNGHRLSMDGLVGDVQLVQAWPGGAEEFSWVPGAQTPQRFRGGELVTAYLGSLPVAAGTLTEPDPSQERMIVQGAYREAEGYVALDSSGNATTVPNTAIDQAIVRGLAWTRPTTVSSSAVDLDVSQGPVYLDQLLDAWTNQSGTRWGVNASRQVITANDATTPSWTTLPLDGGLGFTLDNYASQVIGRYYTGSSYATRTRTASTADTIRHKEAIADLTPRGTLTSTKADTILDNLLNLGRATPQWMDPIALSYGELLTMGGTPAVLETVSGVGGALLRIPGGFEMAQRLNGARYIDIPIGRTTLAGGLLTIEPRDLPIRTLADAIAAALTEKPRRV